MPEGLFQMEEPWYHVMSSFSTVVKKGIQNIYISVYSSHFNLKKYVL